MSTHITVDPITRIEGHLRIEARMDGNTIAEAYSSGTMVRGIEIILRGRDPQFSVLSGDDEITLPVMALGGDGIISVISNVTPKLMSQLCEKMRAGDTAGAREIHFRLLPWMRAAFIESNPLPAKAALAMMGRIKNVLRLPLVPMSDAHESTVRSALETAGALS